MPDGQIAPGRASGGTSGRPGSGEGGQRRLELVAFTADAEAEAAIREGLSGVSADQMEVRRAKLGPAIAQLATMQSPRILLVDVAGEDQPLVKLAELAQVVEPDVRVLVVGDRQDVNFYRQVTRDLGVEEYLYKPLTPDMVARHFATAVVDGTAGRAPHGGRMVAITGARGGAGVTTLAANLAWYFAERTRRHTVLLDADLQTGSAAMLLGATINAGLRTALEQPARVDELFVDRVTQRVAERLHILAAEEGLEERVQCVPGAPARLVDALRRRNNYIVADVPFRPVSPNRELLDLAQQRVIVMLPTLASVREALRLLALPNGPAQPRRAVVVLNRLGMPGGLPIKMVTDALGMPPDVAVPDLPKLVEEAASLGRPAVAAANGFSRAVAQLAYQISGTQVAAPSSGWRLRLPSLGLGRSKAPVAAAAATAS